MRNPARGPFRAFIALSNEFACHPDYRWYINNVLFNLAQLTRQSAPADMRNELRRLHGCKGTLSAVAGSLLGRLPSSTTRIDLRLALPSLPVSEWTMFKALVYAMVNVMTTERNESWMRRFECICTSLCAHPQYMDRLQGRAHRAIEFVRIAGVHVHFKCYRQTTKRALSLSYLSSCMQTTDDTESRGACSICMISVCKRHVRLPCGHVYHKACMLKWLCKAAQCTCPVCRQTLCV